ncbi:GTPase Era [soil metagenome]
MSEDFRCGYVAIVGRPNVGKSTLINALVGQKVSITADKAQTTRHRILGIRTDDDVQTIFVDTPGYQTRHSGALNHSMNRAVTTALAQVDCVVFVVEALKFNDGDRAVLELLPRDTPTILVLSKCDMAKERNLLFPFVAARAAEREYAAVVPTSSQRNEGLTELLSETRKHLPVTAALFEADDFTDRSARFLASETIREKVFRLVGDELPYRTTVTIDKYEEEGAVHRILATILVESDSQRRILIGAGGARIKRIASEARVDLERMLGSTVWLEVWVKERGGWADSDASVRAHGYE